MNSEGAEAKVAASARFESISTELNTDADRLAATAGRRKTPTVSNQFNPGR
jgi:hypothetical protein